MFKTLKELREESYLRADLKFDSGSIPTALANTFVNQAWTDLYDLIISMDDGRIFARNATIPPQIGDYSFRLPADFYHLCSCHVRRNNRYIPAEAADPAQYAELADNTYENGRPRYFLREDPATGEEFIFVFPAPAPSELALTYFPEAPRLELDGDQLTDKNGRLEFVTLGAAMRMLAKLERETATLKDQQNEVRQRLHTAVTNRDLNNPRRIRDISYRFGDWHGYWR